MSKLLLGRAALVLGVLVATGCGGEGPTVVVKGAIMNNGEPVKTERTDPVQILFQAQLADGKPFADSTRVDESGLFQLTGVNGQGIPPGNYKIGFMPINPGKGPLFDPALSPAKSPLQFQLDPEKEVSLIIDIGKKTVSRK